MTSDVGVQLGDRPLCWAGPNTRTWAGEYLIACLFIDLVRHASALCRR